MTPRNPKAEDKISFKYRVVDADTVVDAGKVLDAFQLEFAPGDKIDAIDLYDFVTGVLNAKNDWLGRL